MKNNFAADLDIYLDLIEFALLHMTNDNTKHWPTCSVYIPMLSTMSGAYLSRQYPGTPRGSSTGTRRWYLRAAMRPPGDCGAARVKRSNEETDG